MITGKRAVVVPRVLSPECGYALALEEMVGPYLDRSGVIGVLAPDGFGRTTALQHLAAVFGRAVRLVDHDEGTRTIRDATRDGELVIYARAQPLVRLDHLATFKLAPWDRDDVLEYLMARHRDRCAAIMERLAGPDFELLGGCPELWRSTVDEMANAACVPTLRDALVRNAAAADGALLARHPVLVTMRSASEIASDIRRESETPRLDREPRRAIIDEAVRQMRTHAGASPRLQRIWEEGPAACAPMAASLLHALDPDWRPSLRQPPCLRGARLAGAPWKEVDLTGAQLQQADLDGADLESAALDMASFAGAQLHRARLRGASLDHASFHGAELGSADLSRVRGRRTQLSLARLDGANLEGACLLQADMFETDLSGARLVGADLAACSLLRARLDGADCSRASFAGAILSRLDLRETSLDGACFVAANMGSCRLDGVAVADGLFDHAWLNGAHLTGSRMPGASFRHAALCEAFLAGIDWEGADLRDADLSKASFHMGSSRSGLVDSFIASEGTRTGFYTDDYEEQHFKSPEEIRKANLRGADLRGAKVMDTDFYLVDLRDARYGAAQADHFRRCGAILSRA